MIKFKYFIHKFLCAYLPPDNHQNQYHYIFILFSVPRRRNSGHNSRSASSAQDPWWGAHPWGLTVAIEEEEEEEEESVAIILNFLRVSLESIIYVPTN
jgi:hypothetical protein